MEISDILLFQLDRRFKGFGRLVLNKLQENHDYIKSLENVLIKMGINEEVYKNSEFQYNKDRKLILDDMNNNLRELNDLINGFEVKLKK